MIWVVAAAAGMSGCFFGGSGSCKKNEEYQASRSVETLEVPGDLDTPDARERLVIPPVDSPDKPPKDSPCLEKPPDYFGR